jgi:isopenicillin N synthase-like dioxygenase
MWQTRLTLPVVITGEIITMSIYFSNSESTINDSFFHLINHGLSREQYDGIHDVARKFFAQSEEDKQKHAVEGAFRGYMRGVNSTRGNQENNYETFSFYSSVRHFVNGKPKLEYEQIDANADILGPQNIFIDQQIKQAIITYREQLVAIAVQLIKAIAMVHHGDITQFDWMREAFCSIRFNCYPALDPKIVDEGGYSLAAHSDFG